MITREELFYALNGLVDGAKFCFRPIEQAMPDEIPLGEWSILWYPENSLPCPSLEKIEAYLTDERRNEIAYKEAREKYNRAIQTVLDQKAQERDYDNAISCASFYLSNNRTWQLEAERFILWRDSCWKYALDVETKVKNNEMITPSVEDFINNLPKLNW